MRHLDGNPDAQFPSEGRFDPMAAVAGGAAMQEIRRPHQSGDQSPPSSSASVAAAAAAAVAADQIAHHKGVYRKLGWRSLKALRALVLITVILHVGVSALAIVVAVEASCCCPRSLTVAASVVASGACVRIAWVVGTGLCQAATAVTMIAEEHIPASRLNTSGPQVDAVPATTRTRIERRMWYKRWLWWGRFGALVTSLQVGAACYLSFLAVRNAHSSFCFSGSDATALLQNTLIVLPVTTWLLVFAQCCVRSDVLSWRSLYEMQNEAWRAHYREMFDYGIRELLCCLGRSRYMSKMADDEVDSVAALLGDLVAYRAVGASHLEFLAGVALLRTRKPQSRLPKDFPPAPEPLIKEATVLHPYAVAAYTGPLLDFGRNPLFFPCAWMYRQGLLTIWNRRRRPVLAGDNWWRGHAAAFLRAARLPPEALLKGRVHQRNRETVYFVIELKQLKCVVVAVRGTETPEDLLTDGLGREVRLSESDIHGLIMNRSLCDPVKEGIMSSMPHYGHAGVVAAAQELAFELDSPEDNPPEYDPAGSRESPKKRLGFLTSILGPGGKCEGFTLRFVGHSLGGSIAALAGMMLCHRFPTLHVYGFGVLPCVDTVIAEACSSFVTSIVYNDEFSSRLSVASLMRLRAASLRALAADSATDSAIIARLARRLFGPRRSKQHVNGSHEAPQLQQPQQQQSDYEAYAAQQQHRRRRLENKLKGGVFLCYHACHCVMEMPKDSGNVTVVGTPLVSGGYSSFVAPTRLPGGEHHQQINLLELDGRTLDGVDNQGSNYVVSKPVVEAASDGNMSSLNAGVEKSVEEAVGLMKPGGVDEQDEDKLPASNSAASSENGEFIQGIVNGGLLNSGMPKEDENGMVGYKPGSDLQQMWPVELVMPGLVIHLVRVTGDGGHSRPRRGSAGRRKQHIAILRDRDSFREIIVSPSMFLDHMPWRCQRALNDVVEQFPKGPLPDREVQV